MYCSAHKGLARCDCWERHILTTRKEEAENKEFKLKSHFWFQKQQLHQRIEALEAEVFNAKNNAKCWHEAWFSQRDATGKAYWNGYAGGKRVAIAFHKNEAAKRLNAANACNDPKDKLSQELDARYHEWSANQIMLQGYDVEYDKHISDKDAKPVRWKPSDGLRPGEKDH
jgi:hypothetical protein